MRIISVPEKINRKQGELKNHTIRTITRIQIDDLFICIEVTNTAPILDWDLNRIHEKGEEHGRCKDEGREHDFFDTIDPSESGFSLGFAKNDVILNSRGFGEGRPITIVSSINTTVMLTLPLDILKERFRSLI